ncbi:hypothetical protein EDD11_002638 [Mortierella claussenii]|nr:hypothetical protein EDD11_002638 [Mortierella claussenii]
MVWSLDYSAHCNASHSTLNQQLQPAPEKFPICDRHLREFYSPRSTLLRGPKGSVTPSSITTACNDSSNSKQPLKERISIKPMDFVNYLLDGIALYVRNLRHPSTIPGSGVRSRVYAMGLLPGLVAILVFCQWTITFVVVWSSYTSLGRKAFQLFLKDQILMFDTTDTVDPTGTEEALKQLTDTRPRTKPLFSYYLANILLILSTVTYERDDNLVKSAAHILGNIESEDEQSQAEALLEASEHTIDAKAQMLGMRFMGISELKSLGGPYAGLFYNDETIILVYKGTSVLAFNEYLIDGTIQRTDASEYLYGEVHKGFYESLFPDPAPLDWYERATYDKSNPFDSIMETIFETAKKLKEKTGKPVNLWMTGHSLGGALSALTMARLQLPLRKDDPLFKDCDPAAVRTHNNDGTARTVFDEMLARFHAFSDNALAESFSMSTLSSCTSVSPSSSGSTFPFSLFHRHYGGKSHNHSHSHLPSFHSSHSRSMKHNDKDHTDNIIILRDCYSFASPKLGDTAFAQEFDRHHTAFFAQSPHKPVYYRVAVDKDIVPRLPPGCSIDPDDKRERMFPCAQCSLKEASSHSRRGKDASIASLPQQSRDSQLVSYGAVDHNISKTALPSTPQHLNSLLDYRHVGQLISLYNKPIAPIVKPSEFQANLCAEVLRSEESVMQLLQQIEIALTVASSCVDCTTIPCACTSSESSSTSSTLPFDSVKVTQELARAKARHELDELSRLRVPCDAEKFLLTFPNVISHSPATYQRNLVRSRYYFTSFPGTEMLEKLDIAQATLDANVEVKEADMTKENKTKRTVAVVQELSQNESDEEQYDQTVNAKAALLYAQGEDASAAIAKSRPTQGKYIDRDSGIVVDKEGTHWSSTSVEVKD